MTTKVERIVAKLTRGWDEIQVRDGIALCPGLSVRQRVVLSALVAHANTDRTCFLSTRSLARLGLNKDSVTRIVAELRRAGFVSTVAPAQRHHATSYDLSALPEALFRRFAASERKGHVAPEVEGRDLSESKGHDDLSESEGRDPSRRGPCPPDPVPGVRHEGTQGTSLKEDLKELDPSLSGSNLRENRGEAEEPDPWGLTPTKQTADDTQGRTVKDPPQGRRGADPELKAPKAEQARQIRLVFEYWQTVRRHPAAKLDGKRRGKIQARLREGFTPEQLCRAIDGVGRSEWHCGDNPGGKTFDDLVLVLRDAPQVEKFLELAPKATPGPRPEPPPVRREPPPPPPPRKPAMPEPSAEEREAARAKIKAAMMNWGTAEPRADAPPPRSRRELLAGLAPLDAEDEEPARDAVGGAS